MMCRGASARSASRAAYSMADGEPSRLTQAMTAGVGSFMVVTYLSPAIVLQYEPVREAVWTGAPAIMDNVMRAWRTDGAGHRSLRLDEVPLPVAGRDEALVPVRACGVCRTDLHVTDGDLPPRRSSVTPGHEVVGEVVDVGSEVHELAPGDRV